MWLRKWLIFSKFFYDSVIRCDKIIKESKTVPTNFNEEKVACKTKGETFWSLLVARFFLLVARYFLLVAH